MARYRQKDGVDLAWNQIRRALTRQLDTEIGGFRERALNKLLSGAWEKFSASLSRGEILTLESDYESWVDRALSEVVEVKPVEPDADLAA